jgi:plasmid stabilization system protein ParE
MPRTLLPSSLKNLRSYEVLVTQTTEDDLRRHFQSWSERFESVWSKYYHEVLACIEGLSENPYLGRSWRNKSPERLYEKGHEWLNETNIDIYWKIWEVRRDLQICDMELKWSTKQETAEWYADFLYTMKQCSSYIRSAESDLSAMDSQLYAIARKDWEVRDAAWIAGEVLRKEHQFHHSKDYYEEQLRKYAGDAYGVERITQAMNDPKYQEQESCVSCQGERRTREQRKLEEEEEKKQQEEEEEKKQQEAERKIAVEVVEEEEVYCCETCNYFTNIKRNYDIHCRMPSHHATLKASNLFCDTCKVQCRTQKEYDAHIETFKHKTKANGIQTTFRCEVCDYTATLRHHYDTHCKSKRHLEKMNK